MIIEDPSHTVPSPTRYCTEFHRYAKWRKLALLQRLGASHTKNFEFLLVPLTQCGGTNFKALTIFLFPKIGHLPFF